MGFVRRNAVALTALFIGLAGGAYAAGNAFVGSGGVIKGCVPHGGGPLVVVKPKKACPKGSVELSFNQKGQKGVAGAPGPAGTVVLARVRSTAATQTTTVIGGAGCFSITNCPDASHGTVVPLRGAGWTQAAKQIDQFFGKVVVTVPPSSSCSVMTGVPPTTFPTNGSMSGEVDDSASATPVGSFFASAGSGPGSTQVTVPLSLGALFEPGAAVHHALTVKIADNCGANGGSSGGHFTVDSFALDPVGIS